MKPAMTTLCAAVILALLMNATAFAQKKAKNEKKELSASLPAVIWRDPGNVAALDLFYGAGGKQHAPDPHDTYTFVEEDTKGTSPKFDVRDSRGVRWRVKLGQEPRSETAATRLLWAAGYFVDEDYYLAELKVTGKPELQRGSNFVSADGVVQKARLERKLPGVKKVGDWAWFDNPFLDTREWNGLRVMVCLLNDWDLKTVNNSIYEVNGERRFLVSDAGTALGNTGNVITRSKSDAKGYARAIFIEKAEPDTVDFVMHARGDMGKVAKHIPRADAKWLGRRLSMLSEDQLRDCFRSAGYTPEEVAIYVEAVRKRIAEIAAL